MECSRIIAARLQQLSQEWYTSSSTGICTNSKSRINALDLILSLHEAFEKDPEEYDHYVLRNSQIGTTYRKPIAAQACAKRECAEDDRNVLLRE